MDWLYNLNSYWPEWLLGEFSIYKFLIAICVAVVAAWLVYIFFPAIAAIIFKLFSWKFIKSTVVKQLVSLLTGIVTFYLVYTGLGGSGTGGGKGDGSGKDTVKGVNSQNKVIHNTKPKEGGSSNPIEIWVGKDCFNIGEKSLTKEEIISEIVAYKNNKASSTDKNLRIIFRYKEGYSAKSLKEKREIVAYFKDSHEFLDKEDQE